MPRKKPPLPEIPEVDDDIIVEGAYYKGNENILSKSAKFAFTKDMADENKRCKKSILHFAERHFYIVSLDDGKQKIKLYKFQKRLLKSFSDNKKVITVASRQLGKSTTVTIYALWLACFHDFKSIVLLANKAETAGEIFSRCKLAFEELPIYLKPAVKSWRKNGFDLSNGSSITISGTSSSAVRGKSINFLIIDEMAHISNEIMDELWKSVVPAISASKNGRIICISTPNKADKDQKFYQTYQEALKKDGGWHLETVHYSEVPGRDEEWRKQALKDLNGNILDFKQEYENIFLEPGKQVIDA